LYRGRQAGEVPVVTAAVDNGDGDEEVEGEPEPREAWALDRLCDALLVKGALVPISRKKRISAKESAQHPPSSLLAIWTPLLGSVTANHAHFPAVLTSHIIAHLLSGDDNPTDDEPNPDDNTTTAAAAAAEKASYDVCLATWAAWLIEWRRSADEPDTDVTARRQDAFFQLAQAIVVTAPKHETPPPRSSPSSQTGARALLTALCDSDRRLAGISDAILGARLDVSEEDDKPVWCETDLGVMEARVRAARSLSTAPRSDLHLAPDFSSDEPDFLSQNINLPDGWRLLSEQGGWRPCPIGVFTGSE
jgi:ribosomal biogenesis protein LAS1